jgi:kynurenine formamidase
MSTNYQFPPFDQLPRVTGQPQGCLWGFFDKDGKKDELGTLNLLTEDVVKEASKEIQTGKHIQLDWPMHNIEFPGFGRIPCKQTIKDLGPAGFVGFDDELYINTQSSSQWDSLKHFGNQKQKLYYNGVTHKEAAETTLLGTHNICDRGGIVGRAILADWLSWWESKHPGEEPPSAISTHKIPVSEIEEVLKFQGTVPRQGDIFIMRTGFVRWHNNADTKTRIHGTRENHDLIGVANTEETVQWLYSKHFSAVAGDAQGFEAWPFPEDCCLHEWLLGQWGTPIGELWDLEALSEECKRQKRWSFFFTSAPLRVVGGIASPPCAIAIF